jgi:hypothetical protein
MVRTATVCLELTNASMMTVLASTESDDPNIVNITAYDDALYPTSISSYEKAERNQEFVSITAKRVNSRLVFADADGTLNPSMEVVKTIRTEDNIAPRYIVENSIENIFRGDLPYVARYVKDEVAKTRLQLDINSKDQPFAINAIKYIPMPAMGAIVLETLTYDEGKPITLNGGVTFPDVTQYSLERTYQGYIHFEPVDASSIRFSLSSEVYLSALSCIAIGITKILGELNTYALKSYIGWKMVYPHDATRLINVQIIPATHSSSVKNVRVRIYDNVDDFNQANDQYIVSCGNDTDVDIRKVSIPNPYILMELTSENNTTPCVGRIRLEFE